MKMRQSSRLRAWLPAWVCFVVAVGAGGAPALAQGRYRVVREENFRREPQPNGRLLGSVAPGTELVGGATRSGWVEVTLEGWIWGRSIRPSRRSPGLDHEVVPVGGENLRKAANGTVLARLAQGFLVKEVERAGAWVRVRRAGWMWGRSLQRLDLPAGTGGSRTTGDPVRGAGNTDAEAAADFAKTVHEAVLRSGPDGDTTGMLAGESAVRVVERSGEWVRVQTEAWVHEDDLRTGSEGVLVGVSGAEVRARPGEFVGKVLEWVVQYISLQTADDVRREIPAGERYMLARGPIPEAGFIYALVTAEQERALERISPLAQLVVTVRVRSGRSQFLGNPVVELRQMSVRKP